MISKKNIILTLTIVALVISGILITDHYINPKEEQNEPTEENYTLLQQPDETSEGESREIVIPENTEPIKHTAWIPSWDFEEGFNSLQRNPNLFYSISPVWYSLNPDGTIKKDERYKEAFLKYCEEENILVIPSIASFSHEDMDSMLQTPTHFQEHLNQVMEIVDDERIAGIDLDYESTQLDDKGMYMLMLKQLSEQLHEQDKLLSVTVVAQWGDNIVYPSLPETRQVQDWEEISEYADEIRLMTYDYTSQKSPVPGPISPIPWLEEVISYALTKTSPTKYWLGINLYAYEWVNKKYDPTTNIETIDLSEDIQGNSYTNQTIQEILKDESTDYTYNNTLGEGIATYDCLADSFCTMFYPTKEGIGERVQLADDYGFTGVAYWKLGREDPLLD